jgi:flagellar biosynthesis/type III secretory pathway protein FliH
LDVKLITRSESKGMKRGLERGIKQGLEQGLKQGLEQGLEQARRGSILDVATARFGSAPQGLQEALERVSDLEALKRLTLLAATATPDEVLEAVRREA